jgi:acyl-CoA synthetase (AMP-forming)/AMP-acid ligase II
MATSTESVGVSWLPLFHDMGLVAGVLEPLWTGYRVHLIEPATFIKNPLRWLTAFSKYRGTIGGGPNFSFQACVDAVKSRGMESLDLSSWRLAWNGAEPIRSSTLKEFNETFAPFGFKPGRFAPAFGLAEATLMVTIKQGDTLPAETVVDEMELRNGRIAQGDANARGKRLVSSGQAPHGTEIRIVNPDTRVEVDSTTVGEIWVRSGSVGQGYWNKPAESLQTFGTYLDGGEGPYLRTGDLGFMQDGELYVTGRHKDLIVICGVNHYPQDVEQTVESSHPALQACAGAVFAIEDGDTVKVIAAQEVRRTMRNTLDPNEVFVAIRRNVAKEHHIALDGILLL